MGGARGKEKNAVERAGFERRPRGFREPGRLARLVEHLAPVTESRPAELACEIARNPGSGDMQKRPARGIEPPLAQFGERRDVARRALDTRESERAGRAGRGVADRQHEKIALSVALRERARAVGAGDQQRLHALHLHRRPRKIDDFEQRLA